MAEVKTTNAVNVIEVVQAGPRGPQWSGELSGSSVITGSMTITGSLTVSGSGTLLNIGPFNNTGSIDSSGSININGSSSFIHISSSGDILGANISSSNQIHIGSTDPKLTFFDEGTIGQFKIYKSAKNSYLENIDSNLQDLYIRSYSDYNNIVVDGGNGNVGIGSEVDDKTSKLYVAGNIEATSNITSSGTISASLDVIARTGSIGRVEADQIEATSVVGTFVGNVAGSATGLTGTPSIDITSVSASGDILFDGTNGKIISDKSLDLRFHKTAGSTDTFKVTNEITGKTLFEISELGLTSFGTAGVDANLTAEENMTFWLDYPGNNGTGLKYTWKDYTTTLMELDQLGNLNLQSGNFTTLGNISAASLTGSVNVYSETGSFGQITSPIGTDTTSDTYITLGNDRIDFTCGGVEFAKYKEGSQDELRLGTLSGDVDVAIDAAGSFNKFFVSGENGRVAVNTGTVTSAQFTVKGTISGSGDLKIQGNEVDFTGLPTSDPGVLGRLYTDGTPSAGIPKPLMVSGG